MLILLIASWWLELCSRGGVYVEAFMGTLYVFYLRAVRIDDHMDRKSHTSQRTEKLLQTNKKNVHHNTPIFFCVCQSGKYDQEVNDDVPWLLAAFIAAVFHTASAEFDL